MSKFYTNTNTTTATTTNRIAAIIAEIKAGPTFADYPEDAKQDMRASALTYIRMLEEEATGETIPTYYSELASPEDYISDEETEATGITPSDIYAEPDEVYEAQEENFNRRILSALFEIIGYGYTYETKPRQTGEYSEYLTIEYAGHAMLDYTEIITGVRVAGDIFEQERALSEMIEDGIDRDINEVIAFINDESEEGNPYREPDEETQGIKKLAIDFLHNTSEQIKTDFSRVRDVYIQAIKEMYQETYTDAVRATA